MLEEGFAALDGRGDAARREVVDALDERVRGLHDDQRETRDHVRSMSEHLARTDSSVPALREDIATLTGLVRSLHTELGNIAARLPAPETTAKSNDGGEQPVPPRRAVPAGTLQAPPAPAVRPGAATVIAPRATPTETGTALQPTAPATTPQGASVTTNHTPGEQPSQEEHDQDQALKRAVEAAYHGTPADQPSPTAQAPATKPQDPQVDHGVLLLRAAGVASAEVVAHRHTWEWLAARAADHDHFRTPPAVDDLPDGRIKTTVSGRSLIALLIVLWDTRENSGLNGDWALASTTYQRAATALNGVTGQGTTIRIVLDDGHGQDDEHDEDDEDSQNKGPAGWSR
ncbi:hypothetical protein R6L23_01130 [Streptomyces sp. SR27]|uniref:hypothetical protein n=1 Tax=Streptomyces sp. SR27 TaxID=3076630 RepID=UPI00295B798D|nr:hypothetical protein [Streptomyces sp. SR27]MDV9186849.1 hypothetical protein [Streptomyces sp. SR27]